MSELAYSLHLGSDKNRKNVSRVRAKTNTSGTTSLYYDVKNLYKDEFEEARLEYNSKQTRDDRKIDDYFKKISDNSKNDLACEIIIELVDKKYWDIKDDKFKHKMSNVYKEQVKDLENLIPNFKVASVIIHYDETSPHLHIVGVPIKYKNKIGMSKQVGESDIFTKVELIKLQDKMRSLCIASFNKEYGLNSILKKKQKGRNKDYRVDEMTNYQAMKDEIDKNQKRLEEVSKKSTVLDSCSNSIKNTIDNLKKAPLKKDVYIITESGENKIINYIDKVNETNKDLKKMQMLSVTLNNVDTEFKDNREKIKTLIENNNALSLKVDSLSKKIDKKNEGIKELEEEKTHLQQMADYFQNLFRRLVNFIKMRMLGKDEQREKYMYVSSELYEHGIFSDDAIKEIHEEYIYGKTHNSKSKEDDFEL